MADGNDNGGEDDDKPGYKKPPKHSQWKKGQSGNPKGRKKGSRGLKTDLDEALKATLTITVAGKKRKGTTQAHAMYALAVKSATGDVRATSKLTDLVLALFGPGDRGGEQERLSKQDQELLDRMLGQAPEEAGEDSAESHPAPEPGSEPEADAPDGENADG